MMHISRGMQLHPLEAVQNVLLAVTLVKHHQVDLGKPMRHSRVAVVEVNPVHNLHIGAAKRVDR